ncbi:MAG: hypothetical protein AB1791_00200 [Chloroflexota bacterium]
MHEVIAKWWAWLQGATSQEDERLSHVYSDGRCLWAANGYVLLALDVNTGQSGRVALDAEGKLQVDGDSDIPPLANTLPQGDPVASIVVSAENLRRAAEGLEGFVRISLYGNGQALELVSAGKYALVMPVAEAPEWWFWRPDDETA